MKFLLAIFLTAALSFVFCLFLPWWLIAVAAFAVALLIRQQAGFSFLSAFLALLLLWGTMSLVISLANDHILAHRVSMLVIKSDSPFLLILITGLAGAIVAGLSALSASLLFKRAR